MLSPWVQMPPPGGIIPSSGKITLLSKAGNIEANRIHQKPEQGVRFQQGLGLTPNTVHLVFFWWISLGVRLLVGPRTLRIG